MNRFYEFKGMAYATIVFKSARAFADMCFSLPQVDDLTSVYSDKIFGNGTAALSYDRILAENRLVSHLYHCPFDITRIEGEACLQADILHQSVLELIHSEDREEFRRQLSWRNGLPLELQSYTLNELMSRDYVHHLRRRFTVRFRCLLDNTSGFITLELSGRLQFLHGQARMHAAHGAGMGGSRSHHHHHHGGRVSSSSTALTSSGAGSSYNLPPLGLFVVCSPLGPMPSLNGPQRDMTFKTKHQLDLTVTTIDSRTRLIFNYVDTDLQHFKVYDLLHPEDLQYVAQGHREVFKTGSIGLLVHRWLCKSGEWIWLQSRVRLVMKNNKQDHIIAIHRQLSQQEGMELLIRRSDEYKLPFPLLEPETLLSDDGTSVSNNRLVSDYGGSFTTSHIKDLESNFISSIVNGNVQSGTSAPKADQLCPVTPSKLDNGYSVLDDSMIAPTMKRDSSVNARFGTSARMSKEDANSHNSTISNTNYPYHLQGHMHQAGTNPLRTKPQVKTNGGSGRRRKQSTKSTIHPEYDPANLAYGPKSLALSLATGALPPYATEYGQHESSSVYGRSDFTPLEASLRTGNTTTSFPNQLMSGTGHPQVEFDQVGYYLGWRNSTDHNYLFNSASNCAALSHTTPTPQSCSTDVSDRLFSQGIPFQSNRTDYSGHGASADTAYGHYGTPYDAYSAAMAAAAVVAAANSYHATAPQPTRSHALATSSTSSTSGLSSYVEQTFPRFYANPSDSTAELFTNSTRQGNSSHTTEYSTGQRHGHPFSRMSRERTYQSSTGMDTDASVADPYEMLKSSTGLNVHNMAFNRYLKTNEVENPQSVSKQEFMNYSAFQNLTEKVTQSFGSVNSLPKATNSANPYEPMFQMNSSYDGSFRDKGYSSTMIETGELKNTLISSLAAGNPDLQNSHTMLEPKTIRDSSWHESESSRLISDEFYFRPSGNDETNTVAVINRSTSSACSSSSGRSGTPGTQNDRDFSLHSTHTNPTQATGSRWDSLTSDPSRIVFAGRSPLRSDAHINLLGQGSKQLTREYTETPGGYISTEQNKKFSPSVICPVAHNSDDILRHQSTDLPMNNATEVNGPITSFRETLMGLI
ncbi:unnamed protein product [Echinostoma caproni]|uniref:Aryl hydrocarbon receptor n=1 Tax=Echinostoma caproni TaxID=27848 RepID=A0A183AD10_9TREM|nr:unnamed protein product [Echinostoma caproni]